MRNGRAVHEDDRRALLGPFRPIMRDAVVQADVIAARGAARVFGEALDPKERKRQRNTP
jgi:hypothetical protein